LAARDAASSAARSGLWRNQGVLQMTLFDAPLAAVTDHDGTPILGIAREDLNR
jgi:hypothetical protein